MKSAAVMAALFIAGQSGCKQTAIPPDKEPSISKKPLEPLREMEGEHDMTPPEMPMRGEGGPGDMAEDGENISGQMPPEVESWKFKGKLSGTQYEEAKGIYSEKCAGCHGISGAGDGPMASKLPQPPPDLRAEKSQSLSDGEILWTIREGRLAQGKIMPGFKSLEDRQQELMVGFVRSLKTHQK